MVERTNKYVLKLKNFWRKNKKLFLLVTIAAAIGVAIAAVNTWNYNNSIQKFSLEQPKEISNQEDAEIEFQIGNPELTSETTFDFTVENMQSSTILIVDLNGRQLTEIDQETNIITIPSDRLENQNTITISKRNTGFESQQLVEAEITSYTSLQQLTFVGLNFAALLLIFVPIGYVKYQDFRRRKRMQEEFPSFLRDVVEGTRAGMSLPQAVENTANSNYGALDPKIEKMAAQIEWGIPFDEILAEFGRETRSPVIKRSADTIIQAYTSGGNIQDVLESVGDNIRSIRQLKQERQSQLYGEMITGYIVYMIFIGILIALTTYLLPNLASASSSLGGSLDILGGGGGNSLQQNIELYRKWFTRLVYIQAIFSGLIIGKLSEGEFRGGFKHVAILFAIGYLSVTFFL